MSLELVCQLYRHQLHSLWDFEFFLTLSSILTQSWHNIDTMLTQCRRYPIHEERHFPLSTWLTLDERQFPLVQLRTIDSCFSANPGLKTVSFCPTFHVGFVLNMSAHHSDDFLCPYQSFSSYFLWLPSKLQNVFCLIWHQGNNSGLFWHTYGLSFCPFSFHIYFLIFSDIFIFRQR